MQLESSAPSQLRPQRVVAEIISVGDELTTGAIVDANAPYLSESLEEIGVRTLFHTTIADDLESMIDALALAFRRADVVVCTGGLGATQDDLTRRAVADTLGVELMFDRESFERIARLFQSRGLEMPESNRIQATFPRGATIIPNPGGTAPGFIVTPSRAALPPRATSCARLKSGEELRGETIALFFPGVPAELKEMWRSASGRAKIEEFVARFSNGKRAVFRTKLIHAFGLGESAVEERLPNLIARDRFPTVGITAKSGVITLRIFGEGTSEEECARQIDDVSRLIYDKIGDYVFGEDDETHAQVFSRVLRAQCMRVGLLEWGTRGALARDVESDVLAFARVFGDDERARFRELFPEETRRREPDLNAANVRDFFSVASVDVEDKLTDALREIIDNLRNGAKVDYCLAIGPYPIDIESKDAQARQTVDVALVDLRDPDSPVLRRHSFFFGGQRDLIDPLFCRRAMALLLKNQ